MSKNREQQIISMLRSQSMTAADIAESFGVTVAYVRNIVDYLESTGVVFKTKNQRNVIYNIADNFKREMPLLKLVNSTGRNYLIPLTNLLDFYKKETAAIRSLQNLPLISAKLMMIGYKYQTLTQTISVDMPEFNKRKRALKQELALLQMEITNNVSHVRRNLALLQNIKETEEFWQLEGLAKYFDTQIDLHNNLIPPQPIDVAMSITEGVTSSDDDFSSVHTM